MTDFEYRLDSFFVHKNNKRNTDKSPHYTGKGNIGGTIRNIVLWEKHDKNGNLYFSGVVSDIKSDTVQNEKTGNYNSDVPF